MLNSKEAKFRKSFRKIFGENVINNHDRGNANFNRSSSAIHDHIFLNSQTRKTHHSPIFALFDAALTANSPAFAIPSLTASHAYITGSFVTLFAVRVVVEILFHLWRLVAYMTRRERRVFRLACAISLVGVVCLRVLMIQF
jgi:hypothetical protein